MNRAFVGPTSLGMREERALLCVHGPQTRAASRPFGGATFSGLVCRLWLLALAGTCAGVFEEPPCASKPAMPPAQPSACLCLLGRGQPMSRHTWTRAHLVQPVRTLRGGSGSASLGHADAFSRDLEKKLGGRSKAKKSLANHGFGKLMDDLDQIAETITSTDSRGLPRRKPAQPAPRGRAAGASRSADVDSSDDVGAFSAAPGRKGVKPKLNAPQSLQAVREQAVSGGIDTRGLFGSHLPTAPSIKVSDGSQGQESAVAAGGPSRQLNEDRSAGSARGQEEAGGAADVSLGLEPEVAHLVNIARVASTRGAQSAHSLAPLAHVPARLEREAEEAQPLLRHAHIHKPSGEGSAMGKGLARLDLPGGQMPGVGARTLTAAEMLKNASLEEVAHYWQQNYNDLIKLDQLGAKRKKADLGRGRGMDHIPSAIAPLLSIPAAEDRNAEDIELQKSPWYRQSKALQHIKELSSQQSATGRPSFMDIMTKPGWDKKASDVYQIDDDWNVIPPQCPELTHAAFSQRSDDKESRDHGSSATEFCASPSEAGGRPGALIRDGPIVDGDTDGIEKGSLDAGRAEADEHDWKDGEIELYAEELLEADLADDWVQTLHRLEHLQHKPAVPALLDQMLPLLEHIQGKVAASAVRDTLLDKIAELAKTLIPKWREKLEPIVEKQMALDAIVLPRPRTAKTKKTYAQVKERLRMAGLPTGGKKRKILERLKALDQKEARALHDVQDVDGRNGEKHEPGAGGDGDVELEDDVDSYEPSQVDDRFAAIYTDPEYALDPSHQDFSFVKGRSHHAQMKYTGLKRLVTQDRARRNKLSLAERKADAPDSRADESLEEYVKLAKSATERLRKKESAPLPARNKDDADAQRLLWGSESDDTSAQEGNEDGAQQGVHVGEDTEIDSDSSLVHPSGEMEEKGRSEALTCPVRIKRTKAQKERERRKRQRQRILAHPLHRLRFLRERGRLTEKMPEELHSCREDEDETSEGSPHRNHQQLSKSRKKRLKGLGQRSSRLLSEGVFGGRNLTINQGIQGDMLKLHGFFQRGLLQGGLTGASAGPSLTKGSRHSNLRHSALRWTLADVKEWVGRICHHFGASVAAQYVKIFDSFQVCGEDLVTLMDVDLKDMGVTFQHHRTHILTLIRKLGSRRVSRDTFATQSAHLCDKINRTQIVRASRPPETNMVQLQLASDVGMGEVSRRCHQTSLPLALPKSDVASMTDNEARLVNWKEELKNSTITLDMPRHSRDLKRLPDDELFDNPVGRVLPSAPLPTVDTPFGSLRIYSKQDLIRENSHLGLDGPCPFDCACCVI